MDVTKKVLSCGLPGSGKTTYLAALWHLVTEREIPLALSLHSLGAGDNTYLNSIAARWRNAKTQERTELGAEHLVSMNLQDKAGNLVQLTFPDLSGELFKGLWQDRECDKKNVPLLNARDSMMLFVHADKVVSPRWIVDEIEDIKALGVQPGEHEEVPWDPAMAPTQVMLVDVLQMLNRTPLGTPPSRLAVILSAWDKVEPEGRLPSQFVAERLPLLHQHLESMHLLHGWKAFGVSAQGGDFSVDTERLLAEDIPSKRIRVRGDGGNSHDLSELVRWLVE
jgi:hypothetical protein